MTTFTDEGLRNRRLLLCVFFHGPWGRAGELLAGLRKDGSLRWEIPQHPTGWRRLLEVASDYCDRKECAWRNRHAERGTLPHPLWHRRRPRS